MFGPRRLSTVLSAAVLTIAAAGCGSTSKPRTDTVASTNVATGASTGESSPTATHSTGPTVEHLAGATATTPAIATGPEQPASTQSQTSASKPSAKEEGKPRTEAAKQPVTKLGQVPKKRQFDKRTQRAFMKSCTSQKGSTSSCECIIIKFELMPGEKIRSYAELVALEYSTLHHESVPSSSARVVAQCGAPQP